MPKVSKTITHTVSAKPTRAQLKRKFYPNLNSARSGTYTTGNGYYVAMGDVSVELYKGIRDLIVSIDDDQHPFPFTYSFLQDEEIEMTSGGFAPEFSIGNYNFNVSVDLGQADTYIPRIDFAVYPWIGISGTSSSDAPALLGYGYVGLRTHIAGKERSNGWRTQNNIRKITEDPNEYTFSYTLHMYYNTEYFYIGWQCADQDNIEGLMFFSHIIDREDNDWYYVTAAPGCAWETDSGAATYATSKYTLSYTYNVSSIMYIFKDGVDILPTSECSCVTNIAGYSSGNITIYPQGMEFYVGDTLGVRTLIGCVPSPNASGDRVPEFLINPCVYPQPDRIANSDVYPKQMMDVVRFTQKSDRDVYISNPIVFRGAMRFSNQILMASGNIIPDDEYIFNYKNYYCPGCSAFDRLAYPFLLEF